MEKDLLELFKANNGYLQSSGIARRSLRYDLKNLVEKGDVVMIKRGLYHHSEWTQGYGLGEVCRIIPNGVLCMFSAWQYYELTTHVPSQFHIAIGNKSKVVLPPYPPVKLYYWSNPYSITGVEKKETDEGLIQIYNLEKSVCDAIRFRNKAGIDMASEVLNNYLARKDRNLDLLLKYANKLHIQAILNQYLNVLV